jgi:L-threonylcarbamoyladenylate synthase
LLAEAFWPGPLTLVLPKTPNCAVADLATAGLDTVAIRIPAHPVARDILRAFGGPWWRHRPISRVTSRRPRPPMCRATSTGRIDLIVDGGAGRGRRRIHHRRLLFDEPMLLRPGGVPRAEIERVLGRALKQAARLMPRATADSRWRRACWRRITRRARVWLNAQRLEPGEALLAFGLGAISGIDAAAAVMNLSERGDLARPPPICSAIFARSTARAHTIAVMPIPNDGLGEAINDRLRRAAVGRE